MSETTTRKVFGGKTRGYKCDGCGKLFHWDEKCSWFGSYRDIEEEKWERIWFACSDQCAGKKPDDFGAKRKNRKGHKQEMG